MIKSIAAIKNLAVFRDFVWDQSVLDADGRPMNCEMINIIYGRNYSGKTTLSRIARSLETGQISERYEDPEYEIAFNDGTVADHSDPANHAFVVRVFNEDYVRESLRVFLNDDEDVAPFAVLGEENAALADELAAKEKELGAEDQPGTLLATDFTCRRERDVAGVNLQQVESQLNQILRRKARLIKEDRQFGDVNYDIRKISADIKIVKSDGFTPLDDDTHEHHCRALAESPRNTISAMPEPELRYSSIASESSELLSKVIKPSQPIQELLNDAVLQEWIRNGRPIHEGKRNTCGFCGNRLPDDLWDRLDKHFNEESEDLRNRLQKLISVIDTELDRIDSLLPIDPTIFYAVHANEARRLKGDAHAVMEQYRSCLMTFKTVLESRLENIFRSLTPPDVPDPSGAIHAVCKRFDELRSQSNQRTESLHAEQLKAQDALRLHEVATFVATIDYDSYLEKISRCEVTVKAAEHKLSEASRRVRCAREEISGLRSSMRDERNGAEKVNGYLQHYFGHPSLSLSAESLGEEETSQYRFEIRRDGARAYHLSEGERGLLAFCYFMARLEDVETAGKKPIIWIDDPVSSLDENHIFFIYGLIRTQIIEVQEFSQLFISTHSLGFLKYLRRVSPDRNRAYFLIDRSETRSLIRKMPKHLSKFATEFHYLFHRIYLCAKSCADENYDEFYGFGNNVRKFLEMYLYFKYPDGDDGPKIQSVRLRRFLGDDAVGARVSERLENEYSHLCGLFERGMLPVDVSIMKTMAKLIIDKVHERDPEQFESLLKSIDETMSNYEATDDALESNS